MIATQTEPKTETLVLTRRLPASRRRVFEAWTKADVVKRWFAPGDMTVALAEVDARIGGAYRIVMQNKDGETHSPSGTYEEIVPDERLVFSWQWANSDLVTRVTVEFREISENETELTLTHEGFPGAEIRDRHTEGWSGCLQKLPGVF